MFMEFNGVLLNTDYVIAFKRDRDKINKNYIITVIIEGRVDNSLYEVFSDEFDCNNRYIRILKLINKQSFRRRATAYKK